MNLDIETIINDMAVHSAENIDMTDLMQYFIEGQEEYLGRMTEEELLEYATEYLPGFRKEDYKED